jgi:hypothetical protein
MIEMRDQRLREWLTAEQKSITVKEEGIEMTVQAAPALSPAPGAKAEAPKPSN